MNSVVQVFGGDLAGVALWRECPTTGTFLSETKPQYDLELHTKLTALIKDYIAAVDTSKINATKPISLAQIFFLINNYLSLKFKIDTSITDENKEPKCGLRLELFNSSLTYSRYTRPVLRRRDFPSSYYLYVFLGVMEKKYTCIFNLERTGITNDPKIKKKKKTLSVEVLWFTIGNSFPMILIAYKLKSCQTI
ncbi:hypothetical protein AGLY_012995 [Aphis glycines]|uniref:Uncharacterized protein n=1 Tax=Aphis glycines TaxID=307491 RepID=A0A6G0T7F9_APHGL|nr:hypothetical protein AGLY_012995 [Aphis glycines]